MQSLRTIAVSSRLFRALESLARQQHGAIDRVVEPTLLLGLAHVQQGEQLDIPPTAEPMHPERDRHHPFLR